MKVLVVEDELEIAERLRRGLSKAGFVVDCVGDGEAAWFKGETEDYDAIVLDLGLPKLDGIGVIRKLRQANIATPILALTARAAWSERVEGIDAGADDYMPKPFQMEEVIARLGAITRRRAGQLTSVLQLGDLRIDTRRMTVTEGEDQIGLTALEYRALHYLARANGRVVSQGELADHVYASEAEPDSNALEVLIGRIRRKLKGSFITTRRGFGYMLSEPDKGDAP
jgi:two-component system, OmpR family, response regulator